MRSIALIDYGSGNLRSAEKALLKANEALDRPCAIHTTADPRIVASADGVVLPGVTGCSSRRRAAPMAASIVNAYGSGVVMRIVFVELAARASPHTHVVAAARAVSPGP